MFIRTILFSILLLASYSARAEEVTIARAVALAIGHAPAMKAAEAGRDASREERSIGRAGLLPRIDATGSYQYRRQLTYYDQPRTLFDPDLKYRDATGTLRAVQPLFDLERWAGYRQGELTAESGEMRLRFERQKLMLETAQAYLEATTAMAALKAARAKESAAERLAEQAQALFEGGVAAVNDRLDADARRDLARAERLSAENALDQARSALASLTGSERMQVSLPAIAPSVAMPVGRPEVWEERAAEDSLSVRLARLQFRLAEEESLKAIGSALPKVEAFASIQGNRATAGQLGTGTRSYDQAVGVQVTVPVFSGGGDIARVSKGKRASLQAQFALQDDIRLARLTARQAWLGYAAAVSQLSAMHKAVSSAREAASAARAGREVGLRTVSEVLDADERYYEAEKNLAEAKANFIFAELQLKSSVGMLDLKPLPDFFGAEITGE